MRRALVLAFFLAAACDSQADPDDSSNSPFLKEADNERALGGRVFSGTEDAPGVAVRMDPSPGYANDVRLAAANDPAWRTTTSPNGGYQFFNAPLRYDLTFARGSEVIAFKELSFRYVEPSIGEAATPLGFRARARLLPQPAVKPGNAIAYFGSGTDVTTFRADPARAEGEIEFRAYTTTARIFAVEYDAARGIGYASSWGYADLSLSANAVVDAVIPLGVLEKPMPFTIDTEAPEGFVVEDVEITIDFGVERSMQRVAKGPSGTQFTYTPIPFSRPLARTRAKRADGAVSIANATFVDPKPGRMVLELFEAPTIVELPVDAAGVASPTGTLRASGKGTYEHVLVPASGVGTSLRIVTADGAAKLPDVTRFGLPAPSGRYLWTVTSWSLVDLPDFLGGREARQLYAHAQAPPRVLLFP